MGITRLNNLDFLVGVARLKRRQQIVQDAQASVPIRIVAEADDIKVGGIVLQHIVERCHIARASHLGVYHNLGSRANLTACPDALLQVIGECCK